MSACFEYANRLVFVRSTRPTGAVHSYIPLDYKYVFRFDGRFLRVRTSFCALLYGTV